MIIGERIRKKRIEMGYTQQELGEILGVSKVSVCGYETGTRTPTVAMFLKLSKTLNLPIDYMLGNDFMSVKESGETYGIFIAEEDLEILKQLKTDRELYNNFCKDPKRMIQLINRKLK